MLLVVSFSSSVIFDVFVPLATIEVGLADSCNVTPRSKTSSVSLSPSLVAMIVAVLSVVAASACNSTLALPSDDVCCGWLVESEPPPEREKSTTLPASGLPFPSTTVAVIVVSSWPSLNSRSSPLDSSTDTLAVEVNCTWVWTDTPPIWAVTVAVPAVVPLFSVTSATPD